MPRPGWRPRGDATEPAEVYRELVQLPGPGTPTERGAIHVVEIGGHGVRVRGPLEGLAGSSDAGLAGQGFTAKSRVNQVRLLAHLSRWLDTQAVTPAELTAEQVEEFLVERRRTRTGLFSRKALGPVLAWLAGQGAIPVAAARPLSVVDPPELAGFEAHLRGERRLAGSTVAANMARARRFWAGYVPLRVRAS